MTRVHAMSTDPIAPVAAPASQIRGFVNAPELDNVDKEDHALVELVGVVVLNSLGSTPVCSQWAVDTFERHYNVVFDLIPTASSVTFTQMDLWKQLHYVRIKHVIAAVVDGHLQITVQVSKAGATPVVIEEQIIHIARVVRLEGDSDRDSGHKRQRAAD